MRVMNVLTTEGGNFWIFHADNALCIANDKVFSEIGGYTEEWFEDENGDIGIRFLTDEGLDNFIGMFKQVVEEDGNRPFGDVADREKFRNDMDTLFKATAEKLQAARTAGEG